MKEPDWLKEPKPSEDPVVYVSIPEGAHLSPAISEALAELGRSMHESGRHADAQSKRCLPFSCTLNQCHPYKTSTCLVFLTCKIIE